MSRPLRIMEIKMSVNNSASSVLSRRDSAIPLRVRVHPSLLISLAPAPAMPFSEDKAEKSSLMRIWRMQMKETEQRRASLIREIGAAALREAFRRTGGGDIAHLPFRYESADFSVSCTMSVSVSATGTMHVEVSPWSGEAPFRVLRSADVRITPAVRKRHNDSGQTRWF